MSYFTSRLRLAAPLAIGAIFLPFIASADVASTSPLITNVVASTTATMADISWTTDIPASSQVGYGISSPIGGVYANNTSASTSQVTLHKVTLTNLVPSTAYHFQVVSQNGTSTATSTMASTTAYSGDMLLMTMASTSATTTPPGGGGTGTTTGTTTVIDTTAIQNFITQLTTFSSQINQWIAQLLIALNASGNGGGGGVGTTTPSGGATVEQPANVRAGTNVDFSGHGFGSEEYVAVSRARSRVATAFTNIAGGFSTGSIPVGNTTGMFTYTFVGQTTGKTTTATVTVTP